MTPYWISSKVNNVLEKKTLFNSTTTHKHQFTLKFTLTVILA